MISSRRFTTENLSRTIVESDLLKISADNLINFFRDSEDIKFIVLDDGNQEENRVVAFEGNLQDEEDDVVANIEVASIR